MLVVVAIIGVLAALVFPALNASRRAGQNVRCISNLRQIGVGLLAYVADHDGALVPGAHTQELPKIVAWFTVLNDYLGGQEFTTTSAPAVWLCPSKVPKPMSTTTSIYMGYGWNYTSFGDLVGSTSLGWGSKMAQVTKPSHTIIIGDSKDPWINPAATPQNYYLYRPPSVNLATRHSGRGNYLMLDGHVESLPPTMDPTYFLKNQ
jgi:prepilin-type processing-associated H-X9-DG protein